MAEVLTIIIPTFNHCDLLGECLASLETQSGAAIKVLVVDDASEEDVEGYVNEQFAGVEVFRRAVNGGFAAAVNSGLQKVDTSHVMLLNNDMTLEPDCIETLMRAMNERKLDMIAPLVVWKDDLDTVYSAGDFVRVNGRPESYGFREPRDTFVAPKEIFGVSAGAAIYRKETFDKVGLFDETFVAYFEDVDWCFRARLMGFSAGVAMDAVARHVGSASQEGATWWRSRQCFRNHAILVTKNFPFRLMMKYLVALKLESFHQSYRVVSTARTEFGLLKALGVLGAAVLEWFSLLPYAWWQHRKIQRTRTISVAEVDRMLTK